MDVQQTELPEIVEWRLNLDKLYQQIKQWTQDGKTWPKGQDLPPIIQSSVPPITINEYYSGRYQVPQLLLKKNGRFMWVRPRARWVAGADGRVDLNGDGGRFILLYMDESKTWYWENNWPGEPVPLTGELFRKLAETCLR